MDEAGADDLGDLRAGAVHLWTFDADAPLAPEATVHWLDDAERDRAARLRDPADARRFRARRVARRRILSRYVDAVQFDTTCRHCGADHGKPRLLGPRGPDPSPVRFNASHAAGLGVVVVAWDRSVGVDVEASDRVGADLDAVVDRFLAPAEQDAVRRAADPVAAFLAAWSAKEAYGKLRGHGLNVPLERLDTTAWGEGAVVDPLAEADAFRLLRPAFPGVACAVAVDGDAPVGLRVRRLDHSTAWTGAANPAPSSG